MNKSIIQLGMIVGILALAGFFVLSSGNAGEVTISGNAINDLANGDVQVVRVHVEGSQYIMEPAIIKQGVKVRLEADMTRMPGCSRSVVISAYGVRKSFSSSSNYVEFTPDKAGTFNIACSMNMYTGTFTVSASDGSVSNFVEPAQTGGGSCGANGGGCRCGG